MYFKIENKYIRVSDIRRTECTFSQVALTPRYGGGRLPEGQLPNTCHQYVRQQDARGQEQERYSTYKSSNGGMILSIILIICRGVSEGGSLVTPHPYFVGAHLHFHDGYP